MRATVWTCVGGSGSIVDGSEDFGKLVSGIMFELCSPAIRQELCFFLINGQVGLCWPEQRRILSHVVRSWLLDITKEKHMVKAENI